MKYDEAVSRLTELWRKTPEGTLDSLALHMGVWACKERSEREHYGDDAEGRLDAICEQCHIGYSDRLFLRDLLYAWEAECERENPKPLTLDELREMDGPVWICFPQETWGPNVLVDSLNCSRYKFKFSDYGETWLAYRTKPKEVANG